MRYVGRIREKKKENDEILKSCNLRQNLLETFRFDRKCFMESPQVWKFSEEEWPRVPLQIRTPGAQYHAPPPPQEKEEKGFALPEYRHKTTLYVPFVRQVRILSISWTPLVLKYSRFVPNSGQGWKSSWKQYSYKTDIQFEFVRNLHGSTFYPDLSCGCKLCAVMTAIPWKTSIKKWKYLCWEFFRVINIVLENVKRF